MNISIIIPVLNEKKNILELISRINKTLSKINIDDFEILFVDGGSTDGTVEILDDLSDKDNRIHYLSVKGLSLGKSIVLGIKLAKYDNIIVMDGDLQHPPERIPDLINNLQKYDIVIASRFVKGSSLKYPLFRKIISKLLILYLKLIFPDLKVKDPLSGFFGINRNKISLDKLSGKTWKVLLEILITHSNLSYIEIPFDFNSRQYGKSKANFKELFDIVLFFTKKSKIIKFLIVGFTGIIINQAILYIFTEYFGLYYIISAIISYGASIIWNFFLNSIFTFNYLPKLIKGLSKYTIITAITVLLSLAFLYVFTEFFGLYYLLSNLIAILLSFVFRFWLSHKYVWNKC